MSGGKFLIAEKGEAWCGGCVRSKDMPDRQFVSAVINDHEYKLVIWAGGFAGTTKDTITIQFSGERIVSVSPNAGSR